MPVDIYDLEFQNWLKGVLALDTTREALCMSVSETLGSWINKFSVELRAHIKQFLNCLNKNGVQQLKQRNKSRRKDKKYCCVCEHELCKILFNTFLQEHSDSATLSYQWEYIQRTTDEVHPSKVEEVEMIWRIAVMYMYVEAGEKTEEYHSFDDLDISQVIKLMRSCKLCLPDGSLEYYDELLGFRNCLMHSPKNKVTDKYLKEKLEKTRSLLETLGTSYEYGKELEYLQQLGENKLTILYQSKEHQHLVSEVIKADIIAADLVNCIDDAKAEWKTRSKHLQHLLENIFTNELKVLNSQAKNAKFAYELSSLKSLVKSCIGTKKRCLELDTKLCGYITDEDNVKEQLEKLHEQAEKDLKDINEQLKTSDEENVADLIDHLNEEREKWKTEMKEMENELRMEILSLRSKNISLQSKVGELDVPAYWDDMGGENLRVVVLKEDSKEYQTVKQKFEDSGNSHSDLYCSKIERVQNKCLWQQYQAKKKQLETQNPEGTRNERELWHGTGASATDSINAHGFNRGFWRNSSSTDNGEGVYFAVRANNACEYSRKDMNGLLRVYLCLVLTGEYCKGEAGLRVPPPKPSGGPTGIFDSVTDIMKNPSQFTIFNDSQAFPQYIVYFRESISSDYVSFADLRGYQQE